MDAPLRIAVIGAGINGLASAYCLANAYRNSEVTITADKFTGTTSDHGFGIIMNRTEDRIFDSPEVTGFVRKTAEHCKSMDKHTALKAGVNLRDMFWLCNAKTPQEAQTRVEFFSRTCLNVEEATDQELQELGYDRSNPPNNHQLIFDDPVSAETLYYYKAKVFVIDTSVYMPWLKSLLRGLKNAATGRPRVTFVQRKVTRLSEFTNENIVVNCSGLGAKEIANDNAMVPIRGQYVRIRAPAIQALHFADHSFICPRVNDVCLGSIYQNGRTDTQVNSDDTKDLIRRCQVFVPSLREAEVLTVGVGIRPSRIGGARVEADSQPRNSGDSLVIHNYGHGSKGIAQHWGCALKVLSIAQQNIKRLESKM